VSYLSLPNKMGIEGPHEASGATGKYPCRSIIIISDVLHYIASQTVVLENMWTKALVITANGCFVT
jgi:hypothetical protein